VTTDDAKDVVVDWKRQRVQQNRAPGFYGQCLLVSGDALCVELARLRLANQRMREALDRFDETIAAARKSREPPSGMTVPYHGDFASALPSTIKDLEWWSKQFRAALEESEKE